MKRNFKNNKGEEQTYSLILDAMKNLRNFINRSGGVERLNNRPSETFYWFNNYKGGDWTDGGWWDKPCEPDNSFPDYFYDIERDEIWKRFDSKKTPRMKSQRRLANEVTQTITEYNIEKKDIYISVNAFADKVPQEILGHGIGVGNGIFLINITHFERYRDASS